ncbi:MAG: hypothetical protein NWR39_00765 [Pseudomonadota bacterium]|jgi:hypothetical protein|nr:hypothetical protein [Pseudomonadota bacterium]
MKNIIFLILCLLSSSLSATENVNKRDEKGSPPKKQPYKSEEESSLLYFPLKAELDPITLKKLQAPAQPTASMPVTLWVGGLSRLAASATFLATLPVHIGILINPFEALPTEVLSLISKQGRNWALIIPTRNRFDGEERSPETLNTTKESQAYFEQVIIQTKIRTVFIPDMVDVDQEVLEFIVALAKRYGITLIVPPQFFSNIQGLCQTQGVHYQLLDAFTPSNITLDDFKVILSESMQTIKNTGELKVAVLLTDEAKKIYFNEYIQLIQTNHGLFVDEKPVMQAK